MVVIFVRMGKRIFKSRFISMKTFILALTLLVIFGVDLQIIAAQEEKDGKDEPDLLAEFNKVDNGANQKAFVWNGLWSYGERYAPGTLKITNSSAVRFRFSIEASNGANIGELSGTAKVKGRKAYFDDQTNAKKDSTVYGCRLLFINKGQSLEIKETRGCQSYGGHGVVLGGTYTRGRPVIKINNFVQREVFPHNVLDQKFKLLVGAREYENFLDDFHLIREDEDLDKLNAKVFSGCVRGICPYNAAVIMYDAQNNLWAAIMNLDIETKPRVYYFTNNRAWSGKLPKTIESWVADKRSMNQDLTVVYKSRR